MAGRTARTALCTRQEPDDRRYSPPNVADEGSAATAKVGRREGRREGGGQGRRFEERPEPVRRQGEAEEGRGGLRRRCTGGWIRHSPSLPPSSGCAGCRQRSGEGL